MPNPGMNVIDVTRHGLDRLQVRRHQAFAHHAPVAEVCREPQAGVLLELEYRSGDSVSYRVRRSRIVDSRQEMIDLTRLSPGTLMLVTCYPFDALQPNGPLRYVITALPVYSGSKSSEAELMQ